MRRQLRNRCIEVALSFLTTNNRQLGSEPAHSEQTPDSISTPKQITIPASDPIAILIPKQIADPVSNPIAIQGSTIGADCETRDAALAYANHGLANLTTNLMNEGGISNNHGAGNNQATNSRSNPTVNTIVYGYNNSVESISPDLANCSTTETPNTASIARDPSVSHSIENTGDDSRNGDLEMIVVDTALELGESISSQNSIVP